MVLSQPYGLSGAFLKESIHVGMYIIVLTVGADAVLRVDVGRGGDSHSHEGGQGEANLHVVGELTQMWYRCLAPEPLYSPPRRRGVPLVSR